MKFSQAFELLKQGNPIKREHWGGYWKLENNQIVMYIKDGSTMNLTETTDILFTIDNMLHDDWQVADNTNSTLLNDELVQTHSFGEAIRALKQGKCIARKGWNGKNMFVCKQVPAEIYCNIIPKMSSLPDSAKTILYDRNKSIYYCNQMIIVKPDNTIDSWVASSSDTFAEDWIILD